MGNSKWLICIHLLFVAVPFLNAEGIHKIDGTSKIDQDASLTKRCAHKCRDTCFDPKESQCCETYLIHGFFFCPTCDSNQLKCKDRCYPKTGYKCCHDKVIPSSWKCCTHHCGGKCYNAAIEKCCENKIISRKKRCCKAPIQFCGNNCYDAKVAKCCNNQVIDIKSKCCDECGGKCYNKATQQCCNNNIIPTGQLCCKVGESACGNNKCYNPKSHSCCGVIPIPRNLKCCHGRGIPSSQVCCSPGQSICGKGCYNRKTHKCCTSKKLRPLDETCVGHRQPITTGLVAINIGCFRDHGNRAIPFLSDRILTGNYRTRKYALEKCALAAARRGWKYFSVQHQGQCFSGPNAGRTYNKYGPYNTCKNGKGGAWGNDVYVLHGTPLKKTTNGEICAFPFIYKGGKYYDCTTRDSKTPWCAVTPNYDVDKFKGDCKITCPSFHKLCGTKCYNTFWSKCCPGGKIASKMDILGCRTSGFWRFKSPFG